MTVAWPRIGRVLRSLRARCRTDEKLYFDVFAQSADRRAEEVRAAKARRSA